MISYTQINTYQQCSQKYFFKYIKKEKGEYENIKNIFTGIYIHKFLEYYFKNDINKNTIFIESLKSIDKNIFISNKYTEINNLYLLDKKEEILEEIKNYILEKYYLQIIESLEETERISNFLLEKFEKKEILNNINQIEIEKEIWYNDLFCKIDLFAIDNELNNIIIDFKTTQKTPSQENKIKLQDLIYTYIIYKNYNIIPFFKYFYIIYLKNDIKILENTIKYNNINNIVNHIENIINNFKNAINNNIYIPNFNSYFCNFCEFYKICQGGFYENNN